MTEQNWKRNVILKDIKQGFWFRDGTGIINSSHSAAFGDLYRSWNSLLKNDDLMFSKNFNQEMMQNKREFEAMEGFFLPDEQR